MRHSFWTMMDYERLNKDERIISAVQYLAGKFGENNFKIKDHWDGDLNSIGLADNEEKYLVYISTYGEKDFCVSLENSKTSDDFPYEPTGNFDNLGIDGLEIVFAQHLRLKITDTQQKP
ncbi:hypothetical protein WBG78_30435 [Chryseolinea sp. T2]|uniref:hypothetical protein n=1 Tax=Chryseolinea sp. T2 TaxID=3129255 RepID=UPI00307722C0